MRLRHRVPTIFSLSMLDVLCCGLGAVILLMLLNMWDARRKAAALDAKAKEYEATQSELKHSEAELRKRDAELIARYEEQHHALTMLQARRREVDALTASLDQSKSEAAGLRRDWLASTARAASLQGMLTITLFDLADQRKKAAELQGKLDTALIQLETAKATAALVPSLWELLQSAYAQMAKDRAEMAKGIVDLEKKSKEAASLAESLSMLRGERDLLASRLKLNEDELLKLIRRADEAGLKLANSEKEMQKLMVDAVALRKLLDEQRGSIGRLLDRVDAAEGRFAGIDLAGRNVILLIDISGSMGSVDTDTPDPNKWPEVRRTVSQVLRSLPDLKRFQVIVFSDEMSYLLGSPGQWIEFERNKSPGEVGDALAQVKPKGNTNMYAAFEAAFRFRSQELDAIYVFSDGLPNAGPGLPPSPPRDEAAQSILFGKHVRDTIKEKWNKGKNPVKIHSVGFYYESPNLGAFLWALFSRERRQLCRDEQTIIVPGREVAAASSIEPRSGGRK